MSKTITSEIKFLVELDENRVPEKLTWSAEDGGVELEEAKAMMLSIWDSKVQETLRIDLWTKDMPVDEMKIFIHQWITTDNSYFIYFICNCNCREDVTSSSSSRNYYFVQLHISLLLILFQYLLRYLFQVVGCMRLIVRCLMQSKS